MKMTRKLVRWKNFPYTGRDCCTEHFQSLFLTQITSSYFNNEPTKNITRPDFGAIPVAVIQSLASRWTNQWQDDCSRKWAWKQRHNFNSNFFITLIWKMGFRNMN